MVLYSNQCLYTMNELELLSGIMQKRRSLYPVSYSGEAISDDLLKIILDNANLAPTHAKTEPWRYHIVRPESYDAFVSFMQKAFKKRFSGEAFNELKYNKLEGKIRKSSCIMAIGMVRDEKERIPEWEEIASVSCSVQNIYLSLTASGYGGYWSSPSFVINHAADYFDLEERERCLGLFYIGKPVEELPDQHAKGAIKDKLKWY